MPISRASNSFAFPDGQIAMSKSDWHDYYTDKRIVHQWMQVHLMRDLPIARVLEIGPYFGLVTAMARNAGYEVLTLDIEGEPDIVGDVRDLDAAAIASHDLDAIVCCETLEHLPFEQVDGVLSRLAETGVRYLILSVPYSGSQFGLTLYANRHTMRKRTFLKSFRGLKTFEAPADRADWTHHHWEVGYRNMPLKRWRGQVERYYDVRRTEFTDGCRSVFFQCENRAARRRDT